MNHTNNSEASAVGYTCCLYDDDNPCHESENQSQPSFTDTQGGGGINSLLNSLHIGDFYNFDNPFCNIKGGRGKVKGLVFPSDNDEKKELNQYTLMPTNMRSFFSAEELKVSKLSHEFKFTKGMPVLKVPYTKKYNKNIMSNINNKSLLFNIVDDPAQLNPIMNEKKILEMKSEIIHKIESLEAPKEMLDRFQFQ